MLEDTACLLTPGRWTRLVARSRHAALDREIAAGADPTRSALLAARTAQLARPRMRRQVADDLERVAGAAGACGRRFGALPAPQAVRQNRRELIELARTLRSDGPAYARGIALLELVVIDGAGPAYTDRDGASLARRLRQARECLTG
jgi:hypothetical protein